MLPDPDVVTAILRETGAEDVLPRFRALASDDITEKRPGDLVTIADRDAERKLAWRLAELVPGSLVVGEEAAHDDAAVLRRLDTEGPLWIVDPLDGTWNFANGRPTFAMIVAFVRGGETLSAWIHTPVDGEAAVAVRGEGAWRGGSRLSVSPERAFEAMRATVNLNWFPAGTVREYARTQCRRFRDIASPRCAGWDYVWLASGEKHFALYRRLWAWDHAAGVLLHREAGGYTARLDGAPYRATERAAGLLSAADRHTWEALRDYLSTPAAAPR